MRLGLLQLPHNYDSDTTIIVMLCCCLLPVVVRGVAASAPGDSHLADRARLAERPVELVVGMKILNEAKNRRDKQASTFDRKGKVEGCQT